MQKGFVALALFGVRRNHSFFARIITKRTKSVKIFLLRKKEYRAKGNSPTLFRSKGKTGNRGPSVDESLLFRVRWDPKDREAKGHEEMAKCSQCDEWKAYRYCEALGKEIGFFFCGMKRKTEILCPHSREYLKKTDGYRMGREISRKRNQRFTRGADDPFRINKVIHFVLPLESSFADRFYDDLEGNVDTVYHALSRVYTLCTGKTASLHPENRCREVVSGICEEANESFPRISCELKNKTILRTMRSIRSTSGGISGNRNSLERIDSQFNPDRRWSPLFEG